MKQQIKAVIDTSVWLAIYKSRSPSSNSKRILKALIERLFISAVTMHTIKELSLILKREGFEEKFILQEISKIYALSEYYPGTYKTNRLDNIDPKDNILLAACLESNSDYLITEDKALLNQKHVGRIQFTYPDGFLKVIEANKNYKNISEIKKNIKMNMAYLTG